MTDGGTRVGIMRGRLIQLIALPLAALAAGCSAQADIEQTTEHSVSDASGDVIVSGVHPDAQAVVAAPNNTTADIINTTVEHRAETVWLQVEFRRLRPAQYLDVTADIRTDQSGSNPWQLTALTYRREQEITLYGSGDSHCPTATVEFDYPNNVVTMTVPRGCLDNPTWIKTSIRAATMRYDAPPGSRYEGAVWEDDAYLAGYQGTTKRPSGPMLQHP